MTDDGDDRTTGRDDADGGDTASPMLDPGEDLYRHLPDDGAPAPKSPLDTVTDRADLKKLEVECFASGEIFVTSHWLVKIADGKPVRLTRSRTTEHRDSGQALAVIARALAGPAPLKLIVDNASDSGASNGGAADGGPTGDVSSAAAPPFHRPLDAPQSDRSRAGTAGPPAISDPIVVLIDIWQTMANDPDEFSAGDVQSIFAEHGYAESRPATAADVAESPWPLDIWEEIFALTAAGETIFYPSPARAVLHEVRNNEDPDPVAG